MSSKSHNVVFVTAFDVIIERYHDFDFFLYLLDNGQFYYREDLKIGE